jgi:hypothetical protein
MVQPSKPFDWSFRDALIHDSDNAAIYLAECAADGDANLFEDAVNDVVLASDLTLETRPEFVARMLQAASLRPSTLKSFEKKHACYWQKQVWRVGGCPPNSPVSSLAPPSYGFS